MRTVDALIAARDFFVQHPDQWTRASLANTIRGKTRFCALGGISLVTGCLKPNGQHAIGVGVSCTAGPITAQPNGPVNSSDDYQPIRYLPFNTLQAFRGAGIELLAAIGAIKYANAAAKQLFGEGRDNIMCVNDNENLGYTAVLRVLNLAIKNAKRRHINGARYARAA